MKSLLKIVFNFFVYCTLWWIQVFIMLGICVGMGLWDPSGVVGGTPGVVGLLCLYTSYLILKQINQIQFIKNFFNKD
jgi:hypothetical protein